MPPTAIIADDHAFTLAGMRRALETDGGLDVLGTAKNGIEAISLIKQHRPDCAIVDFSMPGATGLEVLFEGRRWSPDTKFVVVTGNITPSPVQELLAAGVNGIFAKTTAPDRIVAGILRVLGGEIACCETIQGIKEDNQTAQDLTAREKEVLLAISRGMSNRVMSDHLSISVKTIESHRASLMRKLDVNSTAALLVRAVKDGLIDVTKLD